jgi:hypothetical protein
LIPEYFPADIYFEGVSENNNSAVYVAVML